MEKRSSQVLVSFFVVLIGLLSFFLFRVLNFAFASVLPRLLLCGILTLILFLLVNRIFRLKSDLLILSQVILLNLLLFSILSYVDYNLNIQTTVVTMISLVFSTVVFFFWRYYLLFEKSIEMRVKSLWTVRKTLILSINSVLLFVFVELVNKYNNLLIIKYFAFIIMCMLAGVSLLIYSGFIIFKNRKKIEKNTAFQLTIVFGAFAVFWDMASLSPYTLHNSPYSIIYMISGLIILNLYFILFLYITITKKSINTVRKKGVVNFIKQNPYIWVVIVFITLFSFDIKVNPIFDSSLYFKYISQIPYDFDFTPVASFKLLQVVHHSSGALSGYYLLGQFISPFNNVLANIQSLIFMVVSIVTFEKILKYFYSDNKYKWQRALGTAIFAFSPSIYGSSLQITSDLFIGLFMVLMISSALKNNKILTVFFGICMIYSKTPGIVVYLSFALGVLIFAVPHDMRVNKESLKSIFKKYWHYILPAIAFGVWWFIMKNSLWAGNNADTISSSIEFVPDIVVENTLHVFAVNFYWVFYIIILAAIILAVVRIKKIRIIARNLKTVWLWIFITAFMGFFAFNSLYTDQFRHARYIIPLFVFNALFVFIAIEYLFKKRVLKMIALTIISLIMLSSTFRTYDPVLLRCFPYFKSENQTYSLYDKVSEFAQNKQLTDIALYNREYVYVDKLYVDFINEVDYKEDDVSIFIDYPLWNTQFSGIRGHISYIRTQDGRRTYEYDPDNELKAISILSSDFMQYEGLPEQAYFIRLWHQDESILEVIEQKYEIIEYIPINRGPYYLHVYKVVIK